ncbi:hypothetical protein SNE32_04695 [Lysobacter sp. D1-1-M9]
MHRDHAGLLYHEPAFRRSLLPPNAEVLAKTAGMKGLRDRDRTCFQYLTFDDGIRKLWNTTGIPTA